MKTIKCCKNCPDRHLACHSTCERYKQEYSEYQADKQARYKEAHKGDEYESFLMDQIRKVHKNRRK